MFASPISIIDPWLVVGPTNEKKLKRDANTFDMLSASYLYDKLDNALYNDSFSLFENYLPVVSALEN